VPRDQDVGLEDYITYLKYTVVHCQQEMRCLFNSLLTAGLGFVVVSVFLEFVLTICGVSFAISLHTHNHDLSLTCYTLLAVTVHIITSLNLSVNLTCSENFLFISVFRSSHVPPLSVSVWRTMISQTLDHSTGFPPHRFLCSYFISFFLMLVIGHVRQTKLASSLFNFSAYIIHF